MTISQPPKPSKTGPEGSNSGAEAPVAAIIRGTTRGSRISGTSRSRAVEFTAIEDAVTAITKLGFGLGTAGKGKGRFYEYSEVSKRTPKPGGVNTLKPA